MFGPNTSKKVIRTISSSHRSARNKYLYESIVANLKTNFGLQNYNILLLGGSGSVGLESVISSSINPVKVSGGDGKFKNRLCGMSETYNPLKNDTGTNSTMSCHLETSTGCININETDYSDDISSFPFFDLKKNLKVGVTCSNKLLGSIAGFSVIYYKSIEYFEKRKGFTYLDLHKHHIAKKQNTFLTTISECALEDFYSTLKSTSVENIKDKIKTVSRMFEEIVGFDMCINTLPSPVIVMEKSKIPQKLINQYDLYAGKGGYNDRVYIFTYSESLGDYASIFNVLKKNLNEKVIY